MKRLTLNTILTCVALAAGFLNVSGQTEQVKIKLSEKQFIDGVVVGGRSYVELSELSRAISGKVQLARGLRIDGETLSTVDNSGTGGVMGGSLGGAVGCSAKCLFMFNAAGVISSRLVRAKGKDGVERILVPLDDLAKAMGGSVQSDAANRRFNVMGAGGVGGAAEGAGTCVKCLLFLNPQGTMDPTNARPTTSPQIRRP